MKVVRKSVFGANSKAITVTVHLNSTNQYDLILQPSDQLGASIIALERKLNIKIDETRYGLYTNDNQQVNLNAMMKQIKHNEFWLKPEYDISKENVHKVFGVSLEQLEVHPVSRIPFVLHKCIEFLEKERSLRTIGLFRLTGNKGEIERYKRLFESPTAKEVDFPNSIDPNIVTGVAKLFFKEMPEPLLLYRNFDTFVEIGEMRVETDRMRKLRQVVRKLPEAHYEILKIMMEYLIQLIMYSDRNKISSSNMAIVFGPLFLRRSSSVSKDNNGDLAEDNKTKRRGLSQRIKNIYIHTIGDMIESYSYIFEDSEDSDDDEEGNAENNGKAQQSGAHSNSKKVGGNPDKLRNLLKNLAKEREASPSKPKPDDSVAEPSALNVPTLVSLVGGNVSVNPNGISQESTTPRVDKARFFSQLKSSSLLNQKSSLKNVGTKKVDTSPNFANMLPPVTPRNAAASVGIAPSPRESPSKLMMENVGVPALNLSGVDSHKKIIADLEEKLSTERLTVERLKEEKEALKRESMENRKELNKELDDYLEKHKLLKAEMARAKSKWEMTEQEYKDQIQRLEDEVRRLKKENLNSKLATNEDASRWAIHGSKAEEEEELAKKSLTSGSVQVSDRFKRASRRLVAPSVEKPPQEEDKSSDSDSDDEPPVSSKKRSSTSSSGSNRMSDTPKRISSITGHQPNLFEDAVDASRKPSTPKKEEPDDTIATCKICKGGIRGGDSYVQAKGNNYHTGCFTCFGCKNSISGAFAERQGKFFCKSCLDKLKAGVKFDDVPTPTPTPSPITSSVSTEDACGRCGGEIPKSEKVRALKRQFHKHCFNCFKCNIEFVDNKFYSLDGDPVCIDCKRASLKK